MGPFDFEAEFEDGIRSSGGEPDLTEPGRKSTNGPAEREALEKEVDTAVASDTAGAPAD